MTTLEEIQQAIRKLSRFQREGLAEWILNSADFGDAIAEPAAAYAEPAGGEDAGTGGRDEVGGNDRASEQRVWSVDEYLRMEEVSETRHEYVAGLIFAMNSPALGHEIIVGNIVAILHPLLRGSPCAVFPSKALVRIRANDDDIFYYPDVSVACGLLDEKAHYMTEPRLVFEVLSPSTQAIDRREKAFNYRYVSSLEEYVLVAQWPPQVTIYRRSESWFPVVLTSLVAVAEFRSIGLSVTLERIYERISGDSELEQRS